MYVPVHSSTPDTDSSLQLYIKPLKSCTPKIAKMQTNITSNSVTLSIDARLLMMSEMIFLKPCMRSLEALHLAA